MNNDNNWGKRYMPVEVKGKKYAICSICEKHKKKTKDHIPPKCCGSSGKVKYTKLYNAPKQRKEFISQNGITFSFICDECNNLMGTLYDDTLGNFRKMFLEMIETGKTSIKVDGVKLTKSVIGHFLASQSRNNSNLQNYMRAFYRDEDTKEALLKDYSLYCYFYSYKEDVFILNEYYERTLYGDKRHDGNYSSMYFYPFAFLIAEKNKSGEISDLFQSLITKKTYVAYSNAWYENDKLKSSLWVRAI